jgi:hypothetical protein
MCRDKVLRLWQYKGAVFGLFTEMRDKEAQERMQEQARQQQEMSAQEQHRGDYSTASYDGY